KVRLHGASRVLEWFYKHSIRLDAHECKLVKAEETSGMVYAILDRIATYKEKILAIKSKIKSALFYPISVIVVATLVVWVIMVWVIPAFKQVFASFGADLPVPTLIVMAMSDFVVAWWWLGFLILIGCFVGFVYMHRRSAALRLTMDLLMLKIPL